MARTMPRVILHLPRRSHPTHLSRRYHILLLHPPRTVHLPRIRHLPTHLLLLSRFDLQPLWPPLLSPLPERRRPRSPRYRGQCQPWLPIPLRQSWHIINPSHNPATTADIRHKCPRMATLLPHPDPLLASDLHLRTEMPQTHNITICIDRTVRIHMRRGGDESVGQSSTLLFFLLSRILSTNSYRALGR